MLPGSSQAISPVSNIPKRTNLKNLVFSIAPIEDNNPIDVRVPLTPP